MISVKFFNNGIVVAIEKIKLAYNPVNVLTVRDQLRHDVIKTPEVFDRYEIVASIN